MDNREQIFHIASFSMHDGVYKELTLCGIDFNIFIKDKDYEHFLKDVPLFDNTSTSWRHIDGYHTTGSLERELTEVKEVITCNRCLEIAEAKVGMKLLDVVGASSSMGLQSVNIPFSVVKTNFTLTPGTWTGTSATLTSPFTGKPYVATSPPISSSGTTNTKTKK